MYIIDSHCHLEHIRNLKLHTPAVIPGVNLDNIKELITLRNNYSKYKIGFGIHPWFVSSDSISKMPLLKKQIEIYKPNFIGEIGLDNFKPNFLLQEEVFINQLKLAKEFNLPVIIHAVKAYNEVLTLLKKFKINRGIIHGFNANAMIADQFIKQGFLLGIGSLILQQSIINKNVVNIPLTKIVLESDAPFMPTLNKAASTSNDTFLYAQILQQKYKLSLFAIIRQSNSNLLNILA